MFFPNPPPPPPPPAPPAWTSRTAQEPGAPTAMPAFPELPDLAPIARPYLRGASIMGLCYLYEVLTPVEDQLYSPACRPLYLMFEDQQPTVEKTPFIVGELLDKVNDLRLAVIDELDARPTPSETNDREFRAKVLLDWQMRSVGFDSLAQLVVRL